MYNFSPQASGERTSEGEQRLAQICEEAERLQLHLSKTGAAQVQENLSACQKEWKSHLQTCSQSQQDLQETIDLLKKSVLTLGMFYVALQINFIKQEYTSLFLFSPFPSPILVLMSL